MRGSTLSDTSIDTTQAAPRPLRRLSIELLGVVALKVALLMLIWWVAFAPHPKPDTSAAAMARQFAPAATPPPAGQP